MSQPALGLAAVGNALVDVIVHTTPEFIADQHARYGMEPGAMVLVDARRAKELYGQIGPAIEVSGGSAANTMAGFASFGGKGGFIGKIAGDQLGDVFRHDMRTLGVRFETPVETRDIETGRCIILVTPDGQRTMNTYLGAASELGAEDIQKNMIASAGITYLEGYLFDRPKAKIAFALAAELAHESGHRVALTLSDPFCVDRHRHDFLQLVEKHVDILFANEEEIKSLYMQSDFESAMKAVNGHCDLAVLTRGEKGAVMVSRHDLIEIPAFPSGAVVDTTGAGDQFAAGVLYGLSQGFDLIRCGKLGALAAGDVISHIGPRPQKPYSDFLTNR